ncbi:MAG: zinc-dependent metalloprotease [Myxococcales bacterium]|nr:zinc-dependent metalloprotease [Myxococcales bacterium]
MRRSLPLLLAVLAACAERPAPRSTIQHDAIAKSDLQGEWYFRQTVVGVPFTTGFTFIGEQGENEMEKIRWDIQEHLLTARRTYEFVRGTEKGEPHFGTQYQGAPVAAFRIESHFDIVREYNPSTGEEYDKLVENQERKWYERAFLRVDWSQNLVTSFEFLADFDHGGVSSIRQDPAPYYVSDPKDPDAMRLERPAPDQPANYIEVTQKLIASPQTVDFEDFANFPLCWLEYSTSDCASQEIKLRSSFLRANPRDYEPLAYDDHMMDRFGYFTTTRTSYNRQYGQTETGRVRLINRFDLWQHSLSDTACRADGDCGAPSPGVRCVKEIPNATIDPRDGTVSGRCSWPYAVRNLEEPRNPGSRDLGPKKVVYYLNDSFPPDLKEVARQVAAEFDDTFRGVYRRLIGRDPLGPIFALCPNNPVRAGDPMECGPEGTHARVGDLRYNLLYWVDEPTSAQLLGYGPSSHDPETGETISATAFVYGAMIDEYAAMARDVVRLVNGEIATDRFVSGVDVRKWVAERALGTRSRSYTQEQVDAMASQMDLSWTGSLPRTPSVRKAPARQVRGMIRDRSQALAQSEQLGADVGLSARRLGKLQGTELERRLINGEILLARGMDPRLSPWALDPKSVRPLSLVSPETARMIRRERRRLSAKAVDLAASFDDSILGLALQQKGADTQEVWRKLRAEVFRSTALHELGHTVGLRHNFAASYDAMNYPKTYWDLRGADGTLAPRYLDPESQVELQGVLTSSGLKAGIHEFMQSSIMDYGANFNSDIHGLGRYDRAALKFGYGGLLEVFNNAKDNYRLGALQATVTFGEAMPLLTDCAGGDWISIHYTDLPAIVDLNDRADVELSQLQQSVLRKDCAYPDMVEHDANKRLAVPYKFCSDEFEGASPGCAAFDRGADPYEIASAAIQSYRSYYLFNNFKRDRLGFSPEGYLDELYYRYLDGLRSQMQFYVLYRADLAWEVPDDGTPGNFWRSPKKWGPFTVAVTEGFNLLGEILTTPEPGPYYLYSLDDGRDGYLVNPWETTPPDFVLDIPVARYFATEWDFDAGYYWYERVQHVGVFLDKVAALAELTDPETYFLGKDVASDSRQYAINYYRLYAKQITDVFAGALTDRWDRFAPLWNGTQYVRRPISEPLVIPKSGEVPVDPQVGFSVQLYAATFGVALISATFDQTFADSSRVWLQGNGQQITTTLPTVTFSDGKSGKTYVAISYKNGVIETGVAARMIARANELQTLATTPPGDPYAAAALQSYVQLLDAMRSLSNVYSDQVY